MDAPAAGPLPLDGINVLELSTFVSASFTGTILGDFGANVLHVEMPGKGDGQRGLGTFTEHDDDRSMWWMSLARNKRSIAIDLREEASRPVVARLVEWADVISENFTPGTLERWGIGWEWIHELNPRAHLLRVSGYGQTGPYSETPSYERVAQAFSGLMYVTGEPDRPPQRAGLPVCDYSAGVWGAVGVLLAIVHQLRSGDREGQVVDHALYSSIAPLMKDDPAVYARHGDIAERVGNASANVAPGDAYRTSDGHWVFTTTTGDAVFARAMHAIGHPELTNDPRFATNNDRLANRVILDEAMRSWMQSHERDEIMRVFTEHSVPIAPVQSVADLMEHPQVRARGDFYTMDDPVAGAVTIPNVLPRLSGTPGRIRRPAPRLAEHTDEVLVGEMGMSRSDVDAARTKGWLQ